MTWSEDNLHRWLAGRPAASALVGSRGHDAAVLRRPTGRLVTCTDQTIEGVHFVPNAKAREVGHKAAARVLSDLAATAARPGALLLALAAPRETTERRLRDVIDAVDRTGRAYGAALVAGDLARTHGGLSLAVTGIGELPSRRTPPGRDRARPGDVVLLTGPVGGSALGRHLAFEPRIDEGAWLFARGARAMMDVSDGLALDLTRLASASGVRIDLDDVPIHTDARRAARASGRSPLVHALTDGEDHELIVTLSPAAWKRASAAARARFPRLQRIGAVAEGRGLFLAIEGAARVSFAQWARERGVDRRGGFLHG